MSAISHNIKAMLIVTTLFILTTTVQAEVQVKPLAVEPFLDDKVWIKVAAPVAIDWYEGDCSYDYSEYDSYKAYEDCIFNTLEQVDNTQSREWGLNDKVVREKDTIYINIPYRKQPLVFKDYLEPFNEEHSNHYSLQSYDKSNHLLQLLHTMYETQSTVIVNLKTGLWQELYATDLTFPDDITQVVGFNGRQGMDKDIIIWERQKGGNEDRYSGAFASDVMYEQGEYDKKNEVYEARDITWATDNTINVDFYYRVNPTDTVAYRVRYTFKRNPSNGKWQLLTGSS